MIGRVCTDPYWSSALVPLLQDVDEASLSTANGTAAVVLLRLDTFAATSSQLLERRERETARSEAHTRQDKLRYGMRLYRLLTALLLAAAPMVRRQGVAAAGPPCSRAGAGAAGPLWRLVQRMATLATGSCLSVHRDCHAVAGAPPPGSDDGGAGCVLRHKADLRQKLQVGCESLAHSCCTATALLACCLNQLLCRSCRLGIWAACGRFC